MREIPHSPVALYEVAHPFGTLIAETILASVHVRARKKAGHTGESDLIKALQTPCEDGAVHIRGIRADTILLRLKRGGCQMLAPHETRSSCVPPAVQVRSVRSEPMHPY